MREPGDSGMGLRSVGNDHFMTALAVLKKIIDPLLFHQPAREIEICLTVLDTVFPWLILAAKLEVSIESFQHFFEDVRNGFLLKNPALSPPGQKPDFGDNLRVITCEVFVTVT